MQAAIRNVLGITDGAITLGDLQKDQAKGHQDVSVSKGTCCLA